MGPIEMSLRLDLGSTRSLEVAFCLNADGQSPPELLFQAVKNSWYTNNRFGLRQNDFALESVSEYRRQKLPHLLFVCNPLPGQLCRTCAFRDDNSLKD